MLSKRDNRLRFFLRSIALLGFFFILFLFVLIPLGFFGSLPSFEQLENPPGHYASLVYSVDGKPIAKYFNHANRIRIEYNELPQKLIKALLATEDIRFESHAGVDFLGLPRVLFGLITFNPRGGGSTITQQLAKNLFPRGRLPLHRLILRKFQEWIIAIKLERAYTKTEIITMYLNTVDFINLGVGIESAAQVYFGVSASELKTEQSAMLIGMVKNPSLYNPLRRPELTLERRNIVLKQMGKYDFLSTVETDSLCKLPLNLNVHKVDYKEGIAPWFREYLRKALTAPKPSREQYASFQGQQYYEDSLEWATNPLYGWVTKNPKQDGSYYNIYGDGLKIYSTIDSRLQQYANEAIQHHLSTRLQPILDIDLANRKNPPFSDDLEPEQIDEIKITLIRRSYEAIVQRREGKSFENLLRHFAHIDSFEVWTYKGMVKKYMSRIDSLLHYVAMLRSSLLSIDPSTGEVRAWAGGPNFKYFMYDMIRQGKRQPGSVVKPFMYTVAMQNGLSPCYEVPNTEITISLGNGRTWTPQDPGKAGYRNMMVPLSWGLAHSRNWITTWIMNRFGVQPMIDIMQNMGITSPLPAVPALCLGVADISLYELVAAYGAFANRGIYSRPMIVTRIEDKQGNVLANFLPQQKEVLDPYSAHLMVKLLGRVVNSGTAYQLRVNPKYGQFRGEMGGKTGTTQNHSDGWFIGLTPQLVSGVWTGADLRNVHFTQMSMGQGASMALPIWGYYMKKIFNDPDLHYSQDSVFHAPEGMRRIDVNCTGWRKKQVSTQERNESNQEEGSILDNFY